MADLLPLVQTYIGPISKPKHLNYYSALGLDELTEDRGAIALAVEAAIDKLKKADRTQDPKGFEEVVKIVRHARTTLLDGEKKSAYDVQLKALLRKVAPSVLGEDSQLLTESARLKELLPSGDPSAPFSLTDFLKSRPDDIAYETVAERQAALRPLLAANPFDLANSSSRSLPTAQVEMNARPSSAPSELSTAHSEKSTPSRVGSSKSLQEELRRSRRQKNLISGGIAVGGACLLVGFGLWMFLNSRAEQQAMIAQRAANQPALSNQQQPISVNSSTSINETGDDVNASANKKETSPPERTRMNLGFGGKSKSTSAEPATPMQLPTVGGGDADKSTAKADSTAMDKMPMNDGEPISKPGMATMKPESWALAMNAALDAIKKRDIQRFEMEIEKAFAATEDAGKTKQSQSLNLIGQLVPMSDKAFGDGYAGLRATNSISLGGSNQASIVEASPELLVMRVKGKNERFEFDKLPMEWVLAIAELELSEAAIDDAVRGTLLQWDNRATAESKLAANKAFQKAAGKDKKFESLEAVFDSVYK